MHYTVTARLILDTTADFHRKLTDGTIETIASEALDRSTEAMAENQRIIQAAIEALNPNTEMLGRTLV